MAYIMEWDAKKVINAAQAAMEDVSKKVADNIMDDAKRILTQKANTLSEGGLIDQFSVEPGKYSNTFLVWCQGPKKWKKPFHASFVEMGTYKDVAKPFMRPASKKNKRTADKLYQKALDEL